MALTDITSFLFNGQPPESVTKYGTSQTNIPQFMTDYTLGLLNKSNAILSEPYQAYQGPRIQGFTPEQVKAQQLTEQSVGRFMPDITKAQDIAQQSINYNAAQSAQPYLSSAYGINPMTTSAPYAQKAAGTFTGSNVQDYMNPYIGGVVDRLGDLAARNLREKLMPNISADFIRSGTYGSAGQQAAVGQALRDLQESTLAEQNRALAQGYNTAADIFSSDMGRQLQLAGQQGNLALGYQQNLGQLGQIAGNMASQTARDQQAAAQLKANIAQQGQGMNFKDLSALSAVGQDIQAQKQKSLDLAYKDFLAQRDYPYEQLSRMNQLIRGLPMSTQTSTTGTGPADYYSPSYASTLMALSRLGYAKGGHVKRNPNRRSTRGRKRR